MASNPYNATQLAMIAELSGSGPIALLEFRNENTEIIEYIDKKGAGKIRYMTKHNFACEYLESGSQLAAELYTPRLPMPEEKEDMVKPEPPPLTGLKRGTRIVALIGGLQTVKGTTTCKIAEYKLSDGLEMGGKVGSSAPKNYDLNPAPKAPAP